MKFGSIAEFVAFLGTRAAAVEAAQLKGKHAAGNMLVQHSKDMIGEEIPRWADLAPATIEEKQRLGYTGRVSYSDPLLRTGELRASISYSIDGVRVVLGSDDPVAEWQECGTPSISPRPFIGSTMFVLHTEAAELIANYELGAAMGLSGPLKPVQRRDDGQSQ